MIIERVEGNISELSPDHLAGLHLEKVVLPLQSLRQRVQRVTTDHGRELGIRLPAGAPTLQEGDVLLAEEGNLVVVALEPTDVLIIAPDSVYQMGVIAHGLGNRHLPAQFFPPEVPFAEVGSHSGVMVIQYDHTAEHFLDNLGARYARSSRALDNPFRHAEHTH